MTGMARGRAALAAAVVIALQQAAVLGLAPPSSRWFLHSDDAATAYWGNVILRHGLPRVAYASLPAAHSSSEPVALGFNAVVRGGMMVPHVPLAFLYLMAPASALGPKALLAAMPLVAAGTLLGVYALGARWSTPWLGVLGMALVAFHPAFLFWDVFPRSNVLAVGVLCWGVVLSQDRRPAVARAGLLLAASTVAFRYESLPMVAAYLTAWTWQRRADLRHAWPALALVAAGAALFLALAWDLYGTVNVLAVASGTPEQAPGFAHALLASGGVFDVWVNVHRFGPLFALPALGCLALLLGARRLPHGLEMAGLAAGALATAAYVLAHHYAPQANVLYYSQVRYLLPVAVLGGLAVPVLWRPLAARAAWLLTPASAAGLALVAAVAGLVLASTLGFATVTPALREFQAMHDESLSLRPRALFVGSFGDLVAGPRPVIQIAHLPDSRREAIETDAAAVLLREGYTAYGSALYAARDRAAFQADPRFQVAEPPGSHFWVATLRPGA